MRLLSPDKIRTHNQRSVLNRCLGLNLFVQPDIFKVPVQNGDIMILCTDGVWSVIEDEEFAHVTKKSGTPEELCKQLVDLAMERDSDDNLSIVVLQFNQLVSHIKEKSQSWSLQNILKRFTK
jgi:protein phosphatase